MARNLIVTADDYGYTEHIDKGILDAVKKGRVSTVSVFTNINKNTLRKKVNQLKDANPDVGIGVHLTITSMKPVTNAPSMRNKKDIQFFQRARKYNLRKVDLAELRLELHAQIERMADLIGAENIDHLNNHHNFLYIHPDFFDVMTNLAMDYDLPIRSPMNWSKSGKKFFFYGDKNPLTKLAVEGAALKAAPIKNLFLGLKGVSKKAIAHSQNVCALKGVKHPQLFMDQIYGQPYLSDWQSYWQDINNDEIVEQIMHLSFGHKGPEFQKPPWGINRLYFKGRHAEYATLTAETYLDAMAREKDSEVPLVLGTYRDFC